jgi:Tol biopolymer transport system component
VNFARTAARRGVFALAAISAAGTMVAAPGAAHAAASGTLIAYTDNGIYVANADGSGARKVPNVPWQPGFPVTTPTWTADGSAIVFSTPTGVLSIHPDGTGLTALASLPSPQGLGASPVVDPQGKYLLYTQGGQLHVAWPDGSNPSWSADTGLSVPAPAVDPVNGQLLEEDRQAGVIEAVAADGTTTILVRNSNFGFAGRNLAVSPDGSRLAYEARDAADENQVFMIGLSYAGSGTTAVLTGTTGSPVQLTTDDSVACDFPAWLPDGSAFLVSCGGTVESVPAAGGAVKSLGLAGGFPAVQPAPMTGSAAALQLNAAAKLTAPPPAVLPPAGSPQAASNGQIVSVLSTGAPALGLAQRPINVNIGFYTGEAWAPDGSALYLLTYTGIYRTAPNGTNPQRLVAWPGKSFSYRGLAVDATGKYLVFGSTTGAIYSIPTDATGTANPILVGDGSAFGQQPMSLAISPLNNTIVANERGYLLAFTPAGRVYEIGTASVGSTVSISPDGTELVVNSATSSGAADVYSIINSTTDGTGVITGLSAQPVMTIPSAANVTWSADGASLDYVINGHAIMQVPAAGGSAVQIGMLSGYDTTQILTQPVRSGATPAPENLHVVRIWGSTAIGTAIAASQYSYDNYATATGNRQAQAVVLARSDQYYDALAGSMLSVGKDAPLLLTPPTALDQNVAAEISRVLKPGGTVYVLGGTAALSPTIDQQLTTAGYVPHRLAGSNAYGTAIAIANAITTSPTQVMVATESGYQDALSSVSYANLPGTVLVLSNGSTMPAATASYLGQLAQNVTIEGVGGPAATAVNQWGSAHPGAMYTSIVGSDADQTSAKVAYQASGYLGLLGVPARRVGIATDRGWYDGLAGGAAIVHMGGYLLLTNPTTLNTAVKDFNAANGVGEADILGGPAALPTALQAPIGATLTEGVGTSDYTSFTPGSTLPPFVH